MAQGNQPYNTASLPIELRERIIDMILPDKLVDYNIPKTLFPIIFNYINTRLLVDLFQASKLYNSFCVNKVENKLHEFAHEFASKYIKIMNEQTQSIPNTENIDGSTTYDHLDTLPVGNSLVEFTLNINLQRTPPHKYGRFDFSYQKYNLRYENSIKRGDPNAEINFSIKIRKSRDRFVTLEMIRNQKLYFIGYNEDVLIDEIYSILHEFVEHYFDLQIKSINIMKHTFTKTQLARPNDINISSDVYMTLF